MPLARTPLPALPARSSARVPPSRRAFPAPPALPRLPPALPALPPPRPPPPALLSAQAPLSRRALPETGTSPTAPPARFSARVLRSPRAPVQVSPPRHHTAAPGVRLRVPPPVRFRVPLPRKAPAPPVRPMRSFPLGPGGGHLTARTSGPGPKALRPFARAGPMRSGSGPGRTRNGTRSSSSSTRPPRSRATTSGAVRRVTAATAGHLAPATSRIMPRITSRPGGPWRTPRTVSPARAARPPTPRGPMTLPGPMPKAPTVAGTTAVTISRPRTNPPRSRTNPPRSTTMTGLVPLPRLMAPRAMAPRAATPSPAARSRGPSRPAGGPGVPPAPPGSTTGPRAAVRFGVMPTPASPP